MLTAKQNRVLHYINDYSHKTGISPSVEEIRRHMKISSTSGVHAYMQALVERGFIRKLPHKARAIEVLKMPETAAESRETTMATTMQIPYYERIAAGSAMANWAEPDRLISLPSNLVNRKRGSHYALKVSGDSMVGVGILDGDIAVMISTADAKNGEIVAALIDGEVTLKTIRLGKDKIILEPANSAYESKTYRVGEVQVQGTLAGILRNYDSVKVN